MALTGPKRDTWLVKTFGGFIAVVGAALLTGDDGPERRPLERLALASALTLAAADIWFVTRRQIGPTYLADAAVELAMAAATLRRGR